MHKKNYVMWPSIINKIEQTRQNVQTALVRNKRKYFCLDRILAHKESRHLDNSKRFISLMSRRNDYRKNITEKRKEGTKKSKRNKTSLSFTVVAFTPKLSVTVFKLQRSIFHKIGHEWAFFFFQKQTFVLNGMKLHQWNSI